MDISTLQRFRAVCAATAGHLYVSRLCISQAHCFMDLRGLKLTNWHMVSKNVPGCPRDSVEKGMEGKRREDRGEAEVGWEEKEGS